MYSGPSIIRTPFGQGSLISLLDNYKVRISKVRISEINARLPYRLP